MVVALWIIAICEIVRLIQNSLQLADIFMNAKARNKAYAEFIKSLKQSDKEYVKNILEEFISGKGN